MGEKPIQLVSEPLDFFRELVTETLDKKHLKTFPETEFYLVHLLGRFINTENLYQKSENGTYKDEPLALMVKEALEQERAEAQKVMFQQVGDVSLYLAGFFQDSLHKKLVNLDYYVGLGGHAYQQVAARVEQKNRQVIFQELADKFSHFVDVFAEIGDKTNVKKTENDLLRLYDRWLAHGSERDEIALKKAGINPLEHKKNKKQ